MRELKAFRNYFLCSALALSVFLLLVIFVWYPSPFLYADGGFPIVMALIGIQIVFGPLLVLIVYKPGKKGLAFDLTAIAIVQTLALLYGGHALFQNRPLYIVFNVDRFSVISAASIDVSELRDPSLETGLLDKPRLVFAGIPADPELRNEILFESISGGKDIDRRPELYESYESNVEKIVSRGIDIDKWLETHPGLREALVQMTGESPAPLDRLAFIPLLGKRHALLMVLDRSTGQPLGSLDIDPWET